MRLRLIQPRLFAFTLIELLVVIAIIAVLVALLLPTHSRCDPPYRVICISNQKQVALGLLIFAEDHANAFPSTISATNSGAMEPMLIGDVVPCFNAITNYTLKKSIFRCLTDKQRCDGSPEGLLARTNLSYFVSLDASETNSPTYTILTGDRHLTANTKPIGPGLFSLNTNQTVEWSAELHSQNKMPAGGVFSFADGHAEWVSVKSLSQVVARQNMATNRLAVP